MSAPSASSHTCLVAREPPARTPDCIPLPNCPWQELSDFGLSLVPFRNEENVATASSDEDFFAPSPTSARGIGWLLTWSCPLQDGAHIQNTPASLGRNGVLQEVVEAFTVKRIEVRAAVVALEDHVRRSAVPPFHRESHIHVAGLCDRTFAHRAVAGILRKRGIHAHFSIMPFESAVLYLLVPSARKPLVDDAPLFHGEATREQFTVTDETSAPPRKKTRYVANFETLADCILDNNLRSGTDVLSFVSQGFLTGDPAKRALYRFVLGRYDLNSDVETTLTGFGVGLATSLIWTLADTYPLSTFHVPEAALRWLHGEWRTKCLVLVGTAGCGKTRCAIALALQLCVEQRLPTRVAVTRDTEALRDERGQYSAVVFDEFASVITDWIATRRTDSAKHLLDVELQSALPARNRALTLRAQPRIVTSQRPLEMLCADVPVSDWLALDRRRLEVLVTHDLRRQSGMQYEALNSGSQSSTTV